MHYVWNPSICNCQNGNYLTSIMDDWAIICDEVIKSYDEEIKIIPKNFNKKKIAKFLYFICIFVSYYNIIDSS